MDKSFEIAELIVKKIKGTINPEEIEELEKWINANPENSSLFKKVTDPMNQLEKLEIYTIFEKDKSWSVMEDEIFHSRTTRFNTRRILSYAAAIVLPVIIAAGITFSYFGNRSKPTLTSIDSVIKPGSPKAVLVLSDGSSVELDEGEILADLEQEDVTIRNENNTLSYSDDFVSKRRQKVIYNELRTPRGGGYNLTLSDGTEVWLNAGSSFKFPVSFTDSTRQVYLEGEAYFDVSHNGKPFIVSSGNMDVRVLGTSFNISAYPEDSEIRTTLVEGIVRIDFTGNNESNSVSEVLTPNKQALLKKYLSVISIEDVDIEQYTSWMQGKLEFSNETLDVVLKRLARWYDFEYEFENIQAKDYHFSARINNTESISTILEMLEMTTDVKFEFKENTIVVK